MTGGSQLPSFGPLMLAMLTGTHRLHWMNWQKRKRKGYLIAQHEKHLALTLLRGLIALMLGWGNVNPRLALAQVGESRTKQVIFNDTFDRRNLGEQYEVIDPDSNRLGVSNGKLIVVPTLPAKNIILLNKTFNDDFVVTVKVSMQITDKNWISLAYHLDSKNYIILGVAGVGDCQILPWSTVQNCRLDERRQPFFSKSIEGKSADTIINIPTIDDRKLNGYANDEESWYFQLQKEGSKYTGLISTNGIQWTRIGTHAIVQGNGRLGFWTGSGGGFENPAEFDDFIVQN